MWTNISEGLFSIFFRFNLQFNTLLMLNYTRNSSCFHFFTAPTGAYASFLFFFFQGVNDNSACVFKVLSRGTSCE